MTHLLALLSCSIFGLKLWAARLPFFLLALSAYGTLFSFLARKTLPCIAFLYCACVMFTPLMIVYERTASNDVLIASLVVLAYVAASGRSVIHCVFAGVLCALIAGVKPSVYVLVPAVTCGILSARKTRSRSVDVTCFIGSFVCLSYLTWSVLFPFLLRSNAALNHVTPLELIQRTTSHYNLPDLTNFERVFCGLTSFPRFPANTLLSVWAILLTVLPLTMITWRLFHGSHRLLWSRRSVLYLVIPAYTFAASIMNTFYTHYFIPAIMMSPILWVEMRRDLRCGTDKKESPVLIPLLITVSAALAASLFFTLPENTPPILQAAQVYASKVFNLPQKNVWLFTWGRMALWGSLIGGGGVLGLSIPRFLRRVGRSFPFSVHVLQSAALLLCVVLACSICYAQLPMAILSPYIRQAQADITSNIRLCLGVAFAITLALWLTPRMISRGKCWPVFLASTCMLAGVLCPVWRKGFEELTARNHLQQKALRELQATIPSDAIVIGERAPQLLLETSIRASSSFLFNSDPMPIVEALAKKEPQKPLIALLDKEHCYNWQHYQENQNKVSLRLFQKLTLPSFATGKPIEVYAAEIKVRPPIKLAGEVPRKQVE